MADSHTDKIKAERQHMQDFGVTRSQARQALHKAAGHALLEAQSRRFLEKKAQDDLPKPVEIKVSETTTPRTKLPVPDGAADFGAQVPPQQPGGAAATTSIRAVIVVESDDDPPIYTGEVHDIAVNE